MHPSPHFIDTRVEVTFSSNHAIEPTCIELWVFPGTNPGHIVKPAPALPPLLSQRATSYACVICCMYV